MVAKSAEGYTVAAPPWALILSYEHAIRKKTAQILNDGGAMTFVEALKLSVGKGKELHHPPGPFSKSP
jgi:hypothetical protein